MVLHSIPLGSLSSQKSLNIFKEHPVKLEKNKLYWLDNTAKAFSYM